MSLNTITTAERNILNLVATLEQRTNRLQAMIQGAQIDSIRIGTAIITTAKIADGSITTGKIQDAAITNAKVANLSASKVTAGTINAARIGAGTITASKLSVSTLSAISANFGTLTAGSIDGITITGDPVRTSTGNDRVQMYAANLGFVASGNTRAVFQANAGAFVSPTGIGFFEFGSTAESGTFRGVAGMNTALDTFVMASSNTPLLLIQDLGSNGINVETNPGGRIYISCATFQIRGSTKTAIVPTSKGYNALYCVESPEVWFFDVVESMEKVDPLFLEVTEGEVKTITNERGEVMIFRRRKDYAKFRFQTQTKRQFSCNNKLWQN